MRLYNLDYSPYATRIRMQILKKKIAIDIVPPPSSFRTPEFLSEYPLGKIPLLELDNKDCLPESVAIMEYLEEKFTQVPCLPINAEDRARVRVMMSFTDTHLSPVLLPFFKVLLVPGFVLNADEQFSLVADTLAKLDRWLNKYHTTNGAFAKSTVDLGDFALTPTIWYIKKMLSIHCDKDAFEGLNQLNQYWQWIQKDDAVKSELSLLASSFESFFNAKQP